MGDDVLVKIMGLTDLVAAIIIGAVAVPLIGALKWLIVAVLLIKAIPSLFA
ncbi:MAG: hypothetical protein ACK4NX_02795 [Candidatus Paceibacteria bacterium]